MRWNALDELELLDDSVAGDGDTAPARSTAPAGEPGGGGGAVAATALEGGCDAARRIIQVLASVCTRRSELLMGKRDGRSHKHQSQTSRASRGAHTATAPSIGWAGREAGESGTGEPGHDPNDLAAVPGLVVVPHIEVALLAFAHRGLPIDHPGVAVADKVATRCVSLFCVTHIRLKCGVARCLLQLGVHCLAGDSLGQFQNQHRE